MNKKFDIKTVFGKNVCKYREVRGFTQEQLCEKVGMSPSAISNIERGLRFPTTENVNKIIEVLEVERELMFRNEETKEINILEDFNKRFNLIKDNQEKCKILYSVLKVLS